MANKELIAFEKYYALTKTGIDPSVAVRTIANELDITVRTVYNYKKKGQWDKRATERSIKANEELAKDLKEESDKAVKDQRKPFISILNRLIGVCVKKNEIEIKNVRELLQVMELSVQFQKELDMQDVPIISAEYSPEKHIKEINSVLAKVKQRDDEALKKEFGEKADESGLQQTEVLGDGQTDIRIDSSG